MDMYYDDEPAYYFAVQMAGFLGGQVPFHLKRNEISPNLDLQRQIFPFIETAFGPSGSPEYDVWQKECLQEMEEKNANDSSQLTLLRLRRVILQDAADYLTPAFEAFKEQVKDVLSSQDVALPEDMHPNVRMVLQDQQRLIVRQGQIMGRLPGSFESMERELQALRSTAAERLDQAMMYWDTVFDYGMDVFKETAFRIESKLGYLIARLGPSISDFAGSRMPSSSSFPWEHGHGFASTLS
ncbi:hypothetical protein BG015_006258, partial [Linnemannia schmuckeri]